MSERRPLPRKPNYRRLGCYADEVGWYVRGRRENFLALLDRALWLEEEVAWLRARLKETQQ